MPLGLFAIFLAGIGAVWLLLRLAQGKKAGSERNVSLLKGVVWLVLAAALLIAKLWPLALMVLIAAGGVALIEHWRDRTVQQREGNARPPAAPAAAMSIDEAAALLGITPDAAADEIRSAHKNLIAQLHPDKGGTDYLAAKINQARDVLLNHRA